jgi:leucyl aminopeptidase
VLLLGLGKERDFPRQGVPLGDQVGGQALNETGSYEAVVYITEEKVKRREVAWRIEHAVVVAMEAVYRFDQMKSEKSEVRRPLRKLTLSVPQRSDLAAGEAAAARGLAIAHGVDLTRDLGNLPSNICTPTYLGERALALAQEFPDIKATVLERKEIEALGMGSFLSVTNGSDQPPRFIIFEYRGSPKKQRPVVLVGKGITFDTGGISIKPAGDMDHMKFDMCGAASVFGVMRAVAELKAKVNVVGLVAACENMPSGRATKPGDVVTSMSGQTIEILNTDAEGRLILCDALTTPSATSPRPSSTSRRSPAPSSSAWDTSRAACSATTTRSRAICSPRATKPMTAPGRCRFGTTTRRRSKATSPTSPTSGAAPAAASRPPASWRASPRSSTGRISISPASRTRKGKAKGATGRPVPLLTTWLLAQEASA